MDSSQDNTGMIDIISTQIKQAEDFQESVSKKYVRERYERYYADQDYYKKKFPALSKGGWNLVSTDVSDTIEWALPSLMKIFYGSQDVVTVQGVNEEDQTRADVMQELLTYMLQRKNKFFTILYNWFKDSLITGMGIVKCSWDREEGRTPKTIVINQANYNQMVANGMEIVDAQPFDEFGNVQVTYNEIFYSRNQPRIENVLVSEFLYDPFAKDIDECSFIAHKKRVTMSYLRQKEQEGVYANIDKVANSAQEYQYDDLEEDLRDNYDPFRTELEEAAREVTLYECYVKVDVDGDGILEDMIVTLVDNITLRVEENYLGRHPFFVLSPIKDSHRIWPKRSYADLIGELQDQKIALNRQILRNIALTNDPKLIMSEEALNISDYVNGLSVIRKKAGYTMADSVMPMPVTQLHPWTFQYLEYIETQKENRTGITRYNQGLDASSLNKTAHGISQIMSASNQRLELIARTYAETGVVELYRFVVSLIQQFVDQPTVVRLTNKTLTVQPDDLRGEFDLIVNAGIGIATKEANMMNLQTFMTAAMQMAQMGMPIFTPQNAYNLCKRWLEEAGMKNYADYISDPAVAQQQTMMIMQAKQQVLSQMPPEVQAIYMNTGQLPPQVMAALPPAVQILFSGGSEIAGNGQGAAPQGSPTGGFGGPTGIVSNGVVGTVPRVDNQQPQAMQPI